MSITPEIIEWTEKYKSISDFSFMVFGPLDDEYCHLLVTGLLSKLAIERDEQIELMTFMRGIDESEARRLGTCQGINLHVIIPRNRTDLEKFIVEVTLDCFRYLRLKAEYIGFSGAGELV